MSPITEFVIAHQDIFFNKIPYMIFGCVLLFGFLLVGVEMFLESVKIIVVGADQDGVLATVGGIILSVWWVVFQIILLFILFWTAWEALIFAGDAIRIINELR